MTHILISRGGNGGQFSLHFQSHFLPSYTPGSRAPSNEPEEWVWSQPKTMTSWGIPSPRSHGSTSGGDRTHAVAAHDTFSSSSARPPSPVQTSTPLKTPIQNCFSRLVKPVSLAYPRCRVVDATRSNDAWLS